MVSLKPRSTLDELTALAGEVEDALYALLDHSGIQYNDINAGDPSVIVIGWNPLRWAPLERSAQRYVGTAGKLVERWLEFGQLAVRQSASERGGSFTEHASLLERVVQQPDDDDGAPAATIDDIKTHVSEALRAQLDVLEHLPSAQGDGELLLVPDTNALLYKPDIENWQVGGDAWTIVLVPQVVRELDAKKLDPRLKDKAESVVKRLKEYGRRGNTFDGVPVAGKLRLREVAVDADMEHAASWLRAGHGDDELLASALELRWQDLTASVYLATRDRNMQNKARFSRFPYVDVEEL